MHFKHLLDLDDTSGSGFTALQCALIMSHFFDPKHGKSEQSRKDFEDRELTLVKHYEAMAEILLKAGASPPDQMPTSGEYAFLVEMAVRMVAVALRGGEDMSSVIQRVFENFKFFRFGCGPQNQPACILKSASDGKIGIAICPQGMWKGCPMWHYTIEDHTLHDEIGTGSRENSSIDSGSGTGIEELFRNFELNDPDSAAAPAGPDQLSRKFEDVE
jgi:hypothetical protein